MIPTRTNPSIVSSVMMWSSPSGGGCPLTCKRLRHARRMCLRLAARSYLHSEAGEQACFGLGINDDIELPFIRQRQLISPPNAVAF